MWAILLLGAFAAIGLRPERSARHDLRLATGWIVAVLAYVLVTKHLW